MLILGGIHNDGDENRWFEPLKKDICEWFQQGIRDEED